MMEKAALPLVGTWKCDPSKNENFLEFLSAVGK